ncbi:Las1-like-domain-containing protein [Triangularia verruculosa]|uniref:Las1-like-domain-containing protein n=1 Tax=Triangularia verruculosa TaxID=2587418 RepID=A0AAN7AY82_9PEZI|nr:Las1-like-domain-containing protein [Triangularia verruculosa]
MVQYMHTPYPSLSSLLTIRSQFYPPPSTPPSISTAAEKELAVARVALWSHRGSCPHLVESTALLTAVILSDEQESMNASALRAAYAAAFGRFVTGLLDSHQDKARKMSMYEVAKGVGLPGRFVELRHMGVHEGLPGLGGLRRGAREGLRWIWGYFWEGLGGQGGDAEGGIVEGDIRMEGVQGGGEGREITEGGKVEGLVRRWLDLGETVGEGIRRGILWEQIRGLERGVVKEVVERVVEGARDGKVVRRGVGLVRLIDEEENGEGMVVEGADGKEGERGPEMEYVDMVEIVGLETTVVQPTAEERQKTPSWVLYDEATWVPKPIGVV